MFWNGERWLPGDGQPLAKTPQPSRHRIRDLVATIPILLLVPILVIPFVSVQGATPQLNVTGRAMPGARLLVSGTGLPSRTQLRLTWDGETAGMPSTRSWSSGSFVRSITVPSSAKPGAHVLGVVAVRREAAQLRSVQASSGSTLLASTVVTVRSADGQAEVTPAPTLAPPRRQRSRRPWLRPRPRPSLQPRRRPSLPRQSRSSLRPRPRPSLRRRSQIRRRSPIRPRRRDRVRSRPL